MNSGTTDLPAIIYRTISINLFNSKHLGTRRLALAYLTRLLFVFFTGFIFAVFFSLIFFVLFEFHNRINFVLENHLFLAAFITFGFSLFSASFAFSATLKLAFIRGRQYQIREFHRNRKKQVYRDIYNEVKRFEEYYSTLENISREIQRQKEAINSTLATNSLIKQTYGKAYGILISNSDGVSISGLGEEDQGKIINKLLDDLRKEKRTIKNLSALVDSLNLEEADITLINLLRETKALISLLRETKGQEKVDGDLIDSSVVREPSTVNHENNEDEDK